MMISALKEMRHHLGQIDVKIIQSVGSSTLFRSACCLENGDYYTAG
jgi:hypothetical protein